MSDNLILGDKDKDEEVNLEKNYDGFYVDREEAVAIVKHLIKQFEITAQELSNG